LQRKRCLIDFHSCLVEYKLMAGKFIIPFEQISIEDVTEVGGKNASLGEMIGSLAGSGILVPSGYAVTATAYRFFLS